MKRTLPALLAITAVLIASAAVAQPATPASDASSEASKPEALPDGTFIYCDPAKAYYPIVTTCPTNWRTVTSPLRPEPAQTQSDTPNGSSGAQAQAQGLAQAEPVVDEQSRAIEKAKSKGYEVIPSVKDLILDGKELAARSAKVQVIGLYKKIGDNAVLYGSDMDAFTNTDNYIAVLTDDAAREVREALMSYNCEKFMCRVDFGGHMTMCQHLNLLAKDFPEVPCLHVEVQIVYRPGD